jgi:hypothetical protein
MIAAIALVAVAALGGAAGAYVSLRHQAVAQQRGRAVAIRVLCGGEQGVIDAGRAVLLQNGLKPAADDYARTVAAAIEREAGVSDLLDIESGRLRCARVLSVSRAAR